MLFGLPLALWSSIGGGLMGFITKLFTMRMEVQAGKDKHTLDVLSSHQKLNDAQVKNEIALLEARAKFEERVSLVDPHRSQTRRMLTYVITLVAGFMIPAVVVFGDVSWFFVHEWTQSTSGFFGFGGKTTEIAEVVVTKGLPLIWASEFLAFVGFIVSFYVGGSAANMTNPYKK